MALSNLENSGDEEDASTPSNEFTDQQDKNTSEKLDMLEKLQSEEKDLLTKIDRFGNPDNTAKKTKRYSKARK